jgi:hypothetical protein
MRAFTDVIGAEGMSYPVPCPAEVIDSEAPAACATPTPTSPLEAAGSTS